MKRLQDLSNTLTTKESDKFPKADLKQLCLSASSISSEGNIYEN